MAVWLPRFRLNCQTCTKAQQFYRGCKAKAKQPFVLIIDGINCELERCPVTLITPFTVMMMAYYRFFMKGFLPESGGLNRQSAKLLHAFDIIGNEFDKIREEDKKHKRRL